MLFSVSESGWYLIAIAATAFFMIGCGVVGAGMHVPGGSETTAERENRRGKLKFFLLTPVFAAATLGTLKLLPEPAAPILFLYSVGMASIPPAIFPVRGRLRKLTIAYRQDPDNPPSDRLMTAWIGTFLLVVILVAVFALMSTPYGMQN